MPSNLSTSNRMYFLTVQDMKEDVLLIEEMSGHEAVSELFEFRLRLLSEERVVVAQDVIGKWAILRIETYDSSHMDGERHWNGYISRFAQTGRTLSPDGNGDIYTYECDIVPWFWMLTQNEDCRIFQNLSVPDIIETILGEFSFSDFKLELTEEHPQLEYCTQYNETTFDFISRLIEREGIHYYFRHNEDAGGSTHILVFTDNKDSNPALDPEELPFHHDGHAEDFDAIRTLVRTEQMRTRKITLHDWDYKKRGSVGENTPTILGIGSDHGLERYRYPGGFVAQSGASNAETGKHLSKVIMEAEESSHLRFRGDSQIRTLTPGHTFSLYDHPFDEFNVEYMVLSVAHYGHNNLGTGGASDYGNEFTLQPHDTIYRAPLTTRKGQVLGPQTAIVVGPVGEEIYTDDLGRIKVRFPWDRKVSGRSTDQPDDKASCWIRVAQMWAGNGYGTMFIPRIGMEVVVDFLDGDPDKPIAVGCVYNGINKPPYTLPADATKSTIKTLSSKGGGGFNELRFEDKKDSEEIFLHAQKDFQQRTTEKSTCYVGKDMHVLVNENRYEKTVRDQHQTVEGKRLAYVKQDDHLKVDGGIMLDSGGGMNLSAGQDLLASGSMNLHLKGGMSVVLDAGVSMSLKAGGSFITLGPAGVSISGTMVLINSGGAAQGANSPSSAEKAQDPEEAIKAESGNVTDPVQQLQAQALRNASREGQPFCAECAAARAAYQALMA